jgi:hypothetical protein
MSLTVAIVICLLVLLIVLYRPNTQQKPIVQQTPDVQQRIKLDPMPIATQDPKPGNMFLIPQDYATPSSIPGTPVVGTAASWDKLSDTDKINYLVGRYFEYDSTETKNKELQTAQDQYIASLPQDGNCNDNYNGCAEWAASGECDINPEFMLYNCSSSCKSCKLTSQQKQNVTAIFNSRAPPSCVYHGEAYPGPDQFMEKVFDIWTG